MIRRRCRGGRADGPGSDGAITVAAAQASIPSLHSESRVTGDSARDSELDLKQPEPRPRAAGRRGTSVDLN